MSLEMPPPVPVPNEDTEAWWEAQSTGVYSLAYCEECSAFHHPPLEACRRCAGALVMKPVLGTGTIYSFVVQQRAMLPGLAVPRVIGVIELDDQPGLRVTAHLDLDPAEAQVGLAVRARLEQIGSSEFVGATFELIP
jgi:uncharacterized OB-fold protein